MENFLSWFCQSDWRRVGNPLWDKFLDQFEKKLKEIHIDFQSDTWICKFQNRGFQMKNFSLTIQGKKREKIIIGAHYDTCNETPGADDNGSAVAVLLDVLQKFILQDIEPENDIEFVLYCSEEPPFFGTSEMGSFRHAKKCLENKEKIRLMICLEMLGYYSESAGSQDFPLKMMKYLYGDKGNFLLAVSNLKSVWKTRNLVKKMKKSLNFNLNHLCFPIQMAGADWSDHRNYWHFGFPAVMLTDTSFFRNKHYHEITDTPETLDYSKMEQISNALFNYLLNI